MPRLTHLAFCAIAAALVASPTFAQQKTAKQCRDEWRAAKADFQAKGVTESNYVAQCRAGTAAAAPQTPAPAAPPPAAGAPSEQTPATASRPRRTSRTTAAPSGEGQFASEAEAKAHCPTGLVVWANLTSKVYHFSGHRSYGKTRKGAYMCEQEATAQGMRPSKTEKRPGA